MNEVWVLQSNNGNDVKVFETLELAKKYCVRFYGFFSDRLEFVHKGDNISVNVGDVANMQFIFKRPVIQILKESK